MYQPLVLFMKVGAAYRFGFKVLFRCSGSSFGHFFVFVLVRVVWLRNSKGTQDPTALKSITGSYVVNIDDTRGFILEMRLSLEH